VKGIKSLYELFLAIYFEFTEEPNNEAGQTLVEYMLVIVLIAVVVLVVLQLTGSKISNTYSNIGSTLP
jgi:Flp pilus assembly pilin Flp